MRPTVDGVMRQVRATCPFIKWVPGVCLRVAGGEFVSRWAPGSPGRSRPPNPSTSKPLSLNQVGLQVCQWPWEVREKRCLRWALTGPRPCRLSLTSSSP